MTPKKDVTITMASHAVGLRKWDVIKVNSTRVKQLVVRVKEGSNGNTTSVTAIPYWRSKWKLFNWVHNIYLKIKYGK